MKKSLLLFLFASFMISVISPKILSQCLCGNVDPDSKYVEFVFTGKILKVTKEEKANKYQIQIFENFRGMENRKTVEVYDSFYNCSEQRNEGSESLFLVAKDKKTNELFVVGCSYTNETIRKQKQFIEILRWRKNLQNQGGILVGKVTNSTDDKGNSLKPDGVDKVFAESENGENFEANIESDGFYRFTGLKEGIYKVFIKLPENLITYGEANGWSFLNAMRLNVKIKGNEGEIEDFQVLINGIISGKVLDVNGQPVGSIKVNLLNLEGYNARLQMETDQYGIYSFKGLSSGKYLIKVGTQDSYIDPTSQEAAYPTTFFPSAGNQKQAEIIELGKFTVLSDKNITLLPNLKKRLVKGQVLMKNGRPAKNANITVQIKRKDYGRILSSGWYVLTETDANGDFSFYAYDETEYLFQSDIDKPNGEASVEVLFSAKCFVLPKNGEIKPLKIFLEKGDVECNEEKFGF